MTAEITGKIPLEVLRQRMEQARLDKPDVLRTIRQYGKIKKEKVKAALREERRVLSGKFNSIHKKEK
jgi:hypothetical protein